jgi:hypothetical protein
LRFLINKDGLKKVPKTVNDIMKLQTPKTPRELKQITGIINYYSRFIPDMAGIMKPLYVQSSRKKVERIDWSEECVLPCKN